MGDSGSSRTLTLLYVLIVLLLDLYVLNPRFQSWVNYYVFVMAREYVRYYIRWVQWSLKHAA